MRAQLYSSYKKMKSKIRSKKKKIKFVAQLIGWALHGLNTQTHPTLLTLP